ncbi:ABC transporter I family member 6, chloroplastic isoform X2 [Phalaenopsis equestris]|uniref:ABC transporter I family member 6, chloroplastic isoform X2 n=1 Tax=Phalaenopsis equestris TaxID=78828 RepID=UPI0009E1D74C|nr:ABC transporter I family member 6, chloroplastic isoform X2 [Phalaenopsis equestris]
MTARLCFSSLTPLPNLPSVSSSSSSTKVFPISKSLEIQPRFRFRSADRRSHRTYATLTVDSQISGEKTMETAPPGILLEVKNLTAIVAESKQEILRGVNLTINEGEVHAIMGKNGSGKSTFSKVLVGHPDYEVTGGTVSFKGEDLLKMEPETRSHAGLFMSFQTPVEIPGVSNMDFLLMACNARREKRGEPALSPIEVLEAELAILDEIDSGLDVDALQDVAKAINGLLTPHNSILMITHYQRLLDYIKPNYVHIMEAGAIVRTGDSSLAKRLEKEGYRAISAA